MLQINTGKLFRHEIDRTNRLRGVLYSNLKLMGERGIETAAGTLLPTDPGPSGSALVYELDERIERLENGPNFLISHTVEPFLKDFSAVASFGLDIVVAPEPGLVERLTGRGATFSSYHPPRAFLQRSFDETVWLREGEAEGFSDLVDRLLALERRYFLGAMRAIRTYVAALHRIYDDLALAYTLFVSAVESLAQDFDDHETSWTDVAERKRSAIETALMDAPPAVADRVKAALVAVEHPTLNRRYRAFVASHVGAGYYRTRPSLSGHPLAAHELEEALKQAYGLRSRYIHKLQKLPDGLTQPHGNAETLFIDRRPALTFQGLAHLTRHVITEFIRTSPTTEREPYDYLREQSGVVSVMLAPECWVHHPLASTAQARQRLEGFLEQYANWLLAPSQSAFTDLRPMLEGAVALWDQAPTADRPALLALYSLFNLLLPDEDRSPKFKEVLARHEREAGPPSSEILIARTLLNSLGQWPLETHRTAFDRHCNERVKPGGLQLPRLLDSAACLELAERYRQAGDMAEARAFIALAVESHPGQPALSALETVFDGATPIIWRTLLLPAQPAGVDSGDQPAGEAGS